MKSLPGTNMGHFLQDVVMIPVMFWLTWTLVRDRLPELLRLPLLPVASGAMTAGGLVKDAMQRASYVLVALGAWRNIGHLQPADSATDLHLSDANPSPRASRHIRSGESSVTTPNGSVSATVTVTPSPATHTVGVQS